MTGTDIGTLVIAGLTVMTVIGSILLLAYRVGRLTGTVEARMTYGDGDRIKIWQEIGALTAKFDRHIETRHVR